MPQVWTMIIWMSGGLCTWLHSVGYIGYELSRSHVATNTCTYWHALTCRVALKLYPFALYHAPSACCSQHTRPGWIRGLTTGPLFNDHNAPPHNPHKPLFWHLQFSYYQYQDLLSWCSCLATTYEAFAIQSEVVLGQVLDFLCLPSLEQWVLHSEHDDIVHCVIVLQLENFPDNWRPWYPWSNSRLASPLTSIEVLQLGFMSEDKLPTEFLFFVLGTSMATTSKQTMV